MTLQQDNYEFTDRDHQELCLLYENVATNLEELKKRKWHIYGLYSAIVAFFVHSSSSGRVPPLTKPCIIIALFVGVIVVELAHAIYRLDIIKYRKILVGIYGNFGKCFNRIRSGAKGPKKPELDIFDKIFKYGGCTYILTVFSYATYVLWLEECKIEYACTAIIIIMIIFLAAAVFLPLLMDKIVSCIDEKKVNKSE
jgi:hypothetical protein